MITIRNAKILTDDILFNVFKEAFSDYIIKFKFDQDTFMTVMFGKEGNSREYSFVAYKDYKPVGIIIGGINPTMAIKTLRCGGMGVIKEERGSEVAKLLLNEHMKLARNIGCKRVYLEVIKGNNRAIAFYKKMGYAKVYHLSYKTLNLDTEGGKAFKKRLLQNDSVLLENYILEEITFVEVEKLRKKDNTYLPWQGSFEYFKNLNFRYYGVKYKNELVGAIVAGENRLQYIFVVPEHRNRKIAKTLLKKIIKELVPETLRITYSNNEMLEFLTNKYGFVSDGLSQYEMYQNLLID